MRQLEDGLEEADFSFGGSLCDGYRPDCDIFNFAALGAVGGKSERTARRAIAMQLRGTPTAVSSIWHFYPEQIGRSVFPFTNAASAVAGWATWNEMQTKDRTDRGRALGRVTTYTVVSGG